MSTGANETLGEVSEIADDFYFLLKCFGMKISHSNVWIPRKEIAEWGFLK